MKKIVIIGAGISGLYIANLLRQNPIMKLQFMKKIILSI